MFHGVEAGSALGVHLDMARLHESRTAPLIRYRLRLVAVAIKDARAVVEHDAAAGPARACGGESNQRSQRRC